MTDKELKVLSEMFYQAWNYIGYDLRTESGNVSRLGLYETIMDGGFLQYSQIVDNEEKKQVVEKFLSLTYQVRESLMEKILPQKEYECGKMEFTGGW